jgi:hypothetical protein
VLGCLERFSGYTLQTLLAEDAELMQLVAIEAMAKKDEEKGG